MYFVVTLALKILIYASVNCGFSGFASLKLHLFIQPLKLKEMTNLLLVISLSIGSFAVALLSQEIKVHLHAKPMSSSS